MDASASEWRTAARCECLRPALSGVGAPGLHPVILHHRQAGVCESSRPEALTLRGFEIGMSRPKVREVR